MGHKLPAILKAAVGFAVSNGVGVTVLIKHRKHLTGFTRILATVIHFQLHPKIAGRIAVEDGRRLVAVRMDGNAHIVIAGGAIRIVLVIVHVTGK